MMVLVLMRQETDSLRAVVVPRKVVDEKTHL